MSIDENKELWEFVGAVKQRLDNGDKQFDEIKGLLADIKIDVAAYHTKLDKHLTMHKIVKRVVVGIGTIIGFILKAR